MLRKRIIFTLIYADGYFNQSRNFRLQKVGNINWLEQNYKFKEISYFSDINVQHTNEIFNPLSALYVIFQEKPPNTKCQTKKITFNTKKTSKRKSLKQKY